MSEKAVVHSTPHGNRRRTKKNEFLSIDEGLWSGMLENPQYLAKKREDEVSYLWDRLISQFTKHMLAPIIHDSHRI